MPTPEQWKQFAEMQNMYRYGRPESFLVKRPADSAVDQPVDSSAKPGNSFIDKVKSTLGGIGFDPKAAPLPNETVPGYMGRRIRESYIDTVEPIIGAVASVKEPIKQFRDSVTGAPPLPAPREAPTPLEAVPMPVTPKLTSLGNGYGVTGEGANRTYYGPSANVVASTQPIANLRGGFVGAETDAQAAKALQDRAAQNQAAQFNINNMNRAAEAERDLRATRLGVSRGVLDRMEGRNDTEAAVASAAAQSATSGQVNPLSMPGDSFYDTRSRQATYDRAMQQALAGNKQEQKGAAATLTALNDFRDKNLAAQVAQGKSSIDPVDMGKFLLDQQRFNYQQQNDANKFLLDKERFNYQQGLDKERLAIDRSAAEGKQTERQLARQKYMDESRKAFVDEFTFSDPKAPTKQIAGAVFDISQATGVPLDVVSQFYEQTVKDLKIDYAKGGPKDPMALNKLVAARITQAYQGQ